MTDIGTISHITITEGKEAMREYNKIKAIFNRTEDGTKKFIEGDFRDTEFEFLKDNVWQFTEKIDGTNIRIHWDGHKVEFGGRTDKAEISAFLMERLVEIFGSNEAEELFEQKFGEHEVILFGEGYGKKIQAPGSLYLPDGNDFILFDVLIGENYQPRESVEDIAKAFGIDCVPILFEGNLQQGVDFVKSKPMSTIGKAPMEGVVARPKIELRDRCGGRIIVKIKVKDFK